jgi:hypothetical protein
MWAQVQHDLEKMMAAKIYAGLLHDAVYRKFLSFAGFGPSFPTDLKNVSPALRENLCKVAHLQAQLAIAAVVSAGAIEETDSCAKLITGPTTLYRFWDSNHPDNRVSIWWIHRSVIDACKQHAGKSLTARQAWLREHLAVSIDWSTMDRIDTLSLTSADELPAIEGRGKQMRVYSATALYKGNAASADYWQNLGKYFPGGMKQLVLPFIPKAQGEDLRRFLSRN